MKNLKKVLGLLLASVMTMSLMACGSSQQAAAPTQAATEAATTAATQPATEAAKTVEPVTIKFKYWADSKEYSQLMQDIIAKFNSENGKGITVVGEEAQWDGGKYSNNLFTEKMGGSDVDCATWKLTATPLFMNNDLLANLDPYINKWADKDDIDQNIYNVMRQASGTNEVYVMPWNVQVLYVYYRPSYFEKAGVQVPTTYEEFLNCVEKCTMDMNGDGKTEYGFGMRGSNGGQEPWGCFIYGEGGNFEHLDSPESIKGMQDFIDIYTKGYVPPTATADGFQQIKDGFKSGSTAMTIHHTGSCAEMEEVFGDDVSAFAFPKGKGQWTSMGDTETVMFESCKNKEAAFEWMSYLATGAGQEMWCKGTGNIPVSKRVSKDPFFQDNRFMKASIDGQGFAGIIPIRDTTTEWVASWPNIVQEGLTGKKTAEEVMKKLQEELYK